MPNMTHGLAICLPALLQPAATGRVGKEALLVVLYLKRTASQTEHGGLSRSQHSSSLSQEGIFWQLSQAQVVLLLSQILFPRHALLSSTESQPCPSDNLRRAKDLCKRKAALSLAFFGKGCSSLQDVPSSAGKQDKLSALETEIARDLILPCYGLTRQTEKSLSAARLALSLASLSDSRKASWGFPPGLACKQGLGECPAAKLKCWKPGA